MRDDVSLHLQRAAVAARQSDIDGRPAKLVAKEEKALVQRTYGYAIVDGVVQKMGNTTIEPPSLFRGRGKHPPPPPGPTGEVIPDLIELPRLKLQLRVVKRGGEWRGQFDGVDSPVA